MTERPTDESAGAGEHVPVLLQEVLTHLVGSSRASERADGESGIFVDATFGRGGHSRKLLERLSAQGQLLGLDRDPEALAEAQRLAGQDPRFSFCQARFSELQDVLRDQQIEGVRGVLMDVGVSSPQLDRPERGFSFTAQGPLDMRMNPEEGSSAAEWLNQADEAEIAQVLWMYGEERQSRRIARAIVAARPLTTTLELADLVAQAVPRPRGPQRKHPATRTFQAVRIFVNEEAQELDQGLQQGFSSLAVGGRLAVISFHSLEDRKVKHAFRQLSQPPKMPRRLPVRNLDQEVQGRLIGSPMKPSLAELNANPRSRSATLRVIEKVR
jgi:16S rRNA (cytosine1402-N4)-methyltransferase